MYKQSDGMAMGSPLDPTLVRFLDDTFAVFGSELECDQFKSKLKLLHPALKFTVERRKITP